MKSLWPAVPGGALASGRVRLVLALLLATPLLGCQGGQNLPPGHAQPAGANWSSTQVMVEDFTPSGQPGVDYAPDVILVRYIDGAALPPGFETGRAALTAAAAARPNPVLRVNQAYGVITSAVAAAYGLRVRTEAYRGNCNFAAFDVPAGADGPALLSRLRSEFDAVLAGAGFSPLARAGFLPDDPDFLNSTVVNGGQWGHRRINCEYAWDFSRGDPDLLIGVVDTGVRLTHEDLAGQVLDPEVAFPGQQLDLANGDNTMEDGDGHGTAVTGIVAATTDNATAVASVAHNCRVIPVKIANSRDFATYADMAAGCLLAAALGARVVNLSWYGGAASGVLKVAVDQLAADGVLVVVCAGNNGSETSAYPAAYDSCMSVGATNDHDGRTDFSNWGSDVDVAAPGEDLKVLSNNGGYREWWGTSFAAPMLAGGAALLWSRNPELSLANVRSLLERSGPPAMAFQPQADVRRLDLLAVFNSVVSIAAPQPTRLIQREELALTPQVSGDVLSVELYANDLLVAALDTPPWDFQFDLGQYGFEQVELEFRAVGAAATASDFLRIIVDNDTPVWELAEDFDGGERGLLPLDARSYAPALLAELRQMEAGQWTAEQVAGGGPGFWAAASGGYNSTTAMFLSDGGEDYGAFETDVLIARGFDLSAALDAELSFYARYNIEQTAKDYDRGWVLATPDLGQTFTPLERDGQPLSFGGFTGIFEEEVLDLSDWLGEQFHVVFLFESDADGSGEQAGEQAGWWLDEISLGGTFVLLGGVGTSAAAVPGAVTGVVDVAVSPTEPLLAERVDYWLDFAPLGAPDAYDILLSSSAAPFGVELDLTDALGLPNQLALLRATPIGPGEFAGPTETAAVYVFNQLGDVNGDGWVDMDDTALFGPMLGLSAADDGYVPFYDSDLDGLITESDAGAVGYHFGSS